MPTLKIEYGSIKLEYEGATDFQLADVKSLVDHLAKAQTGAPVVSSGAPVAPAKVQPPSAPAASGKPPMLHMNSIAAKLDVRTVTDLAIAAAAKAQIFEGLDSFGRDDLLARMKEASKYYKQSHGNNLNRSLIALVGQKFNQIATNVYSLNAQAQTELEARLAD